MRTVCTHATLVTLVVGNSLCQTLFDTLKCGVREFRVQKLRISLNVLNLLAHLLDQQLEVNGGPGHFHVHRF